MTSEGIPSSKMAAVNMLNFNVGILGHVDSGKTALAKAVSTVASTASFDKNPQSQERGITLDLGFSSFCVDIPEHLKRDDDKLDTLQFTFVDCPGHASLIKTVIGGNAILSMAVTTHACGRLIKVKRIVKVTVKLKRCCHVESDHIYISIA